MAVMKLNIKEVNMKKLMSMLLVLCSFTVVSNVSAAEVEIEWFEPEHYRDVKPSSGSKSAFQKRVFRELTEHFSELAAKLPENQTLKIKVTDVDLAGDIRYMVGPNNLTLRVVENIYFPRMEFSYQLLDSTQQVLKSGDENIKDMAFNSGIHTRRSNDSYYYEKQLLSDWYHDSFEQQ